MGGGTREYKFYYESMAFLYSFPSIIILCLKITSNLLGACIEYKTIFTHRPIHVRLCSYIRVLGLFCDSSLFCCCWYIIHSTGYTCVVSE